MGSSILNQDFPYDILKRGHRDASRHSKRIRDAAKKQLKNIVSQQNVISSEKNKKVKVRLKDLEEYRFIHNRDYLDVVGRDEFDELKEGDVLSQPSQGGGRDNQATDDPGENSFDVEFTIEQITDMMIEDLCLPNLDEKKKSEIVNETVEYNDLRKKHGVFSCIDKKRTILAHNLRKAKEKKLGLKKCPITNDDLVFRTWDHHQEKHSNAVVFLMLDRSGSMYEDKIYAVKALYFWMVQFLKRKYDRVEIRFISHDSTARELNENEFFTTSYSGGTMISSAYELCRDMIKQKYPKSMWNIYCFHSSDGDSYDDEDLCVNLVKEITDLGATLFGYVEIMIDSWKDASDLLTRLEELSETNHSVATSVIGDLSDILVALKLFLSESVS